MHTTPSPVRRRAVRSRAAGVVVTLGLTVAAVPALAPSAEAAPAPAAGAVHVTQATKAKAQAQQARQLRRIKQQTRALATSKIRGYRSVRTNADLMALLPGILGDNSRSHARTQEAKLARLRTRATNARTVARAKAVRTSVRSVDPRAFNRTVRSTAIAVNSDDPGVLHDLLEKLLAGPLAGSPLEPTISELNDLLNETLAGSPDTAVVEEVLTVLHDLLEQLTLSPDTHYVEDLLVVLHDLLTAVLP